MSFKLKKTSILTGSGSMVEEGREVQGKLYIKGESEYEPKEIFTLEEVEVNSPILVFDTYYNFIRTSSIQHILKNEDGSLALTTETSIYSLSKVEE